jgi:hypothetical protein
MLEEAAVFIMCPCNLLATRNTVLCAVHLQWGDWRKWEMQETIRVASRFGILVRYQSKTKFEHKNVSYEFMKQSLPHYC